MAAPSPLTGLRVLDLTRVVAGPFSAQILGDLGADVVKVERPGEGDDLRRVGPPWMSDAGEGSDESTYFQSVNRNKRSIAVDFSQPGGAGILRGLAAQSDVLVENYRPGTLANYGLDYAALAAINPRLIYCAVTGFGQTGPYAGRSGYDYLAQGMGGLMSVTGKPSDQPGGEPMRVGIPVADILTGMNAVIAVLAALRHRDATGAGQFLDIALLDSQVSVMLNAAASWLNADVLLGRTGNDHPSATPYGVYEVDDGQIIIATFNDREFARLASALGHPEWRDDPRFARNSARVANRQPLRVAVQAALLGKTRAEWVAALDAAKVSCGPINEMNDVVADPQVLAREMIVELQHPVLGAIKTVGSPYKMSASPVSYRRPPPLAGEHTDEVLSEMLGLDSSRLDQLRSAGVIG